VQTFLASKTQVVSVLAALIHPDPVHRMRVRTFLEYFASAVQLWEPKIPEQLRERDTLLPRLPDRTAKAVGIVDDMLAETAGRSPEWLQQATDGKGRNFWNTFDDSDDEEDDYDSSDSNAGGTNGTSAGDTEDVENPTHPGLVGDEDSDEGPPALVDPDAYDFSDSDEDGDDKNGFDDKLDVKGSSSLVGGGEGGRDEDSKAPQGLVGNGDGSGENRISGPGRYEEQLCYLLRWESCHYPRLQKGFTSLPESDRIIGLYILDMVKRKIHAVPRATPTHAAIFYGLMLGNPTCREELNEFELLLLPSACFLHALLYFSVDFDLCAVTGTMISITMEMAGVGGASKEGMTALLNDMRLKVAREVPGGFRGGPHEFLDAFHYQHGPEDSAGVLERQVRLRLAESFIETRVFDCGLGSISSSELARMAFFGASGILLSLGDDIDEGGGRGVEAAPNTLTPSPANVSATPKRSAKMLGDAPDSNCK